MRKRPPALDVSNLPGYAFGPRILMWRGTLAIIAVEGPIFVNDNAFYWYFAIIAWLPVFAVIYLIPR
ncbi:MAG TPA: hypothetical protein VIM99_16020 [Blastocatellia bacterium]